MALYVMAKGITGRGDYGPNYLFEGVLANTDPLYWAAVQEKLLCDLVLTNDPDTYDPDNARFYEEGHVGATDFPCGYKLAQTDYTGRIAKNHIVSISTLGSPVVMPEDCTGLFSNMALGFCDPYSFVGHGLRKAGFNGELVSDETWSTEDKENIKYKDVQISLSSFDFSNTKNMTSLFENCTGTQSQKKGEFYYEHRPNENGREFVHNYYTFKPRSIRFSGLDSWDTSNVEIADRMFANINGGISSYSDSANEAFCIGGTNNIYLPKVKSAENLFAGSTINLNGVTFQFGDLNSNLSSAFNSYKSYNSTELDISNGKFSEIDCKLTSMFRNTGVSKIILGKALNGVVSAITTETYLNYMFANDGNVNKGVLKSIEVKGGTDGHEMNPVISGYKMFINDTGLPNFVAANNDINYANNTKANGYFDQAPPEIIKTSFFKTSSGWKESEVFIKTESGWKPSEVYF